MEYLVVLHQAVEGKYQGKVAELAWMLFTGWNNGEAMRNTEQTIEAHMDDLR